MKNTNKLYVAIFLLAIILIALVSFVGIYQYDKGRMVNVLPEYEIGKEVKGSRFVVFKVDTSTKNANSTNETSSEEVAEGEETTKEEPVNASELLTKENYKLSKEIIEQRLETLETEEYDIRVNEENGNIVIDLPEASTTDDIIPFLMAKGNLSIVATDSQEILLSKDDLENAQTMYNSGTNGVTVYLDMKFKETSKQKLEDITKEYVATTDDSGNKTQKTITIKIDDDTLLTTYFGETISTGEIQIPIGNATTDQSEVAENVKNTSNIAMLLNGKTLPIVYTLEENQYVSPVINNDTLKIVMIVGVVLAVIAILYMIVKHAGSGIFAGASFIGYIALLLLLVRITNVPIAVGSIVAIYFASIIELVFLIKLLKSQDNEQMSKELIQMILTQIPLYIVAVVLCFGVLVPMVSFGTALFWGLAISTLYNYLIAKFLLKD